MILGLLLIAAGWAGPLTAPAPPEAFPGGCGQSIAIRAGGAIPSAIVGPDGFAPCNWVALPTNELAYLLKLEEYHHAQQRLHALDVDLLKTERNWYRDQLATMAEPAPWYESPAAQRWGGRLEVLAVVGILGAGFGYYVNR